MARSKLLEPTQISPAIWQLAKERTRALVGEAAFFKGDLYQMLANAYIQGVTDVANNCEITRRPGN